jgi:hypothetical protein
MRIAIQILCLMAAVWIVPCATNSGTSAAQVTRTLPTVQIAITPSSASVRARGTQQFHVTVRGTTNSTVIWSVNGVKGGNSALGIINSGGMYIAPQTLPTPNKVTVSAVSTVSTAAKSSAAITLLNSTPILSNVSPSLVNAGSFTLTITGSYFVRGAQVTLSGVPLTTSFVNATQLLASGSQATPGSYAVTVTNPNPGASKSFAINLIVNGNSQSSACSGMSLGPGASLNGVMPFPANTAWNQNISTAPVDPNSNALISFIGGTIGIHPDFGSGPYNGGSIGIPYAVVGSQQAPVNVTFNAYGAESDPGPMPVPANAPIEGFPNPGDQHVLVLDRNNCWLYELYGASANTNGSWKAASAAVWDLENYNQRPLTWTSADAAGLPVFPGLARYDEVASGSIKHALRFTLRHSRAAFVLPATHWAANSTNANAAPMGMRLRLKSSFNTSTFSPANRVILEALKQYGMIMADNGSSMFLSGAPDARWSDSDLHALGQVKASDFEVVKMGTIYTSANVPQGQAPGIHSFSASPSGPVRAGTPVTLSWSTTNASYSVVSPEVGAVRGNSVNVSPKVTTTYTLYATNEFGRSTATVTVTVQ